MKIGGVSTPGDQNRQWILISEKYILKKLTYFSKVVRKIKIKKGLYSQKFRQYDYHFYLRNPSLSLKSPHDCSMFAHCLHGIVDGESSKVVNKLDTAVYQL